MADMNGDPVIGIICDNLRDMPDALRNQLFLSLPDALRNSPLIFTLTNADSKDNVKISAKTGSKIRESGNNQ